MMVWNLNYSIERALIWSELNVVPTLDVVVDEGVRERKERKIVLQMIESLPL